MIRTGFKASASLSYTTMFALENLGNTCYFNTTIQCLFHTKDFRSIFDNQIYSGPTIDVFREFNKTIQENDQDAVDKALKDLLIHIQKSFGDKMIMVTQNDMCEFLLLLFDLLNTEMKTEMSDEECLQHKNKLAQYHKIPASSSETIHKFNIICIRKWVDHFKTEYNDINNLTSFMTVSQIKCACSKVHHNYEVNNTLQLDIKECSELKESLNQYVKSVYFNNGDEENIEWTCDKCKEQKKSKKVTTFWKFPNMLIIFLKRFVMKENGSLTKLTHEVSFEKELDLSKFVLSNSHSSIYTLRSIGCHKGRLNYGHYYAMLRHEDRWVKADDETLIEVDSINRGIHRHAYMLVYERMTD